MGVKNLNNTVVEILVQQRIVNAKAITFMAIPTELSDFRIPTSPSINPAIE